MTSHGGRRWTVKLFLVNCPAQLGYINRPNRPSDCPTTLVLASNTTVSSTCERGLLVLDDKLFVILLESPYLSLLFTLSYCPLFFSHVPSEVRFPALLYFPKTICPTQILVFLTSNIPRSLGATVHKSISCLSST